ncbi:LAME_0G10814g1_1 [Lachancea meyersii CBS 8951]|uniref:LAME_0G10814g1_1 n=1 Tax=Lachancea meyersii CBS 8951 TaxID=1266667 RepID=A0A1G4K943_9SACH|nr:LAME_0G10814g1_1 [Lachancea meyersii CBS 8951]
MEVGGAYGLYPLFLHGESEFQRHYLRISPSSVTKTVLNELALVKLNLANAVESGVLRYETGAPNNIQRGLLTNEEELEKFRSCFQQAHTAVIRVDRSGNRTALQKSEKSSDSGAASPSNNTVSIRPDQLESLISSIQKLELSLSKKQEGVSSSETHVDAHCDTLHEEVVCDGCFPGSRQESQSSRHLCNESGFIKGPRYKCLYCYNYDLCSECVARGVETGTHKKYHNMIKINTPDPDLNKLCSDFRTRTHTKPVPQPEFKRLNQFAVASTDTDVIIDIPERDAKVFEYFTKVETEQELAELVYDHEDYHELLHKVGGDKTKLTEAVERFLAPNFNDLTPSSLAASVETAREDDNLILVEVSKREHVISFRLWNKCSDSVPSGLKLVFRCFEPPSTVPIKCTLHMGPHEFQKGHYKTLNFNCRGLIDNLLMQNTYQVDLVDDEDQVVYTGCSQGEPTICLRPLVLMGVQESVYSEARGHTSLAGSAHEDSDDHDVISNTVSNDEGSRHSDLEDYDFLSDSDIDV